MNKHSVIVSGHQPAYLPWLGLLHKASLCDIFVFMDDVQFIDRDFIHRNRVITPDGKTLWLTVPIDRKNSLSNTIKDILISQNSSVGDWQRKHMLTLKTCYSKALFFRKYWPFFEWLYMENRWEKIVDLNLVILKKVFDWFHLDPKLIIASQEGFNGKKSDLVLEHALRFKADKVVTGPMGRDYIKYDDFKKKNIKVIHQEYHHPQYSQGVSPNISHLSFVDLLFRYGPESPEIAFSNNIDKDSL